MEAETRLRFERTDQRLDKTEQKIDAMGQRIESISSESQDISNVTVDDYCQEQALDINRAHLRGMCSKLALENQIAFRKNPNSQIPMDDFYPKYLIEDAVNLMKK